MGIPGFEFEIPGIGSFSWDGISQKSATSALGHLRDATRARLHIFKIRRATFAHAVRFRRRVDRDKDKIRAFDITFQLSLLHPIFWYISVVYFLTFRKNLIFKEYRGHK